MRSSLERGNAAGDSVTSSLHSTGNVSVPDRLSESIQPSFYLVEPDIHSNPSSGGATSEPLVSQCDCSQSCSVASCFATKSHASSEASQVGPNVDISEELYDPKLLKKRAQQHLLETLLCYESSWKGRATSRTTQQSARHSYCYVNIILRKRSRITSLPTTVG